MPEMAECQTVADKIQTIFTARLVPWFWDVLSTSLNMSLIHS